ncbi:hypothetical protein [Nocardioides sp. URHA0020]|uniref:hypothetical protein n=1 Tax=Nocardioides sp. URHA0020 TaxID=1380392 RepID=UPI0018CC7B64|nr:hypothetical protein [Nocardioides sp. URHA0020]
MSFLIGLGAGYVLGARSGRERYEQIAQKAQQVWNNPRVQEKAGQAQQVAQEKAGQAGQLAKDKVGQAGSAVKEKVSSTSTSDGDGTAGAGTHGYAGTVSPAATDPVATSAGNLP